MATAPDVSFNKEKSNYLRLCRAIIDLGTEVLRQILSQNVTPNNIKQAVKKLKLKLLQQQKTALSTINGDYSNLDISFLYTLIRGLCTNQKPTRGWDPPYPPTATEVSLGDDVERIHFLRNYLYAHVDQISVSDITFQEHWKELEELMSRMDGLFGGNFRQSLLTVQTDTMDLETIKKGCYEGKSAIAHHIATDLQNQDYDIVPVESIEDLQWSWKQGSKQVFVLDDIFGVLFFALFMTTNWLQVSLILEMKVEKQRNDVKILLNVVVYQGTYVLKESEFYKLTHTIIYDVVVSTLTSEFQSSMLKHCSSQFINQKVCLSFAQLTNDRIHPFIVLDEIRKQEWLDRLVLDMTRGNYLDVFFNTCLKDESIEELFLNTWEKSQFGNNNFLKVLHRSKNTQNSDTSDELPLYLSMFNFDNYMTTDTSVPYDSLIVIAALFGNKNGIRTLFRSV
ncbi:hypothetical protein KUTeg_024120 [Tegillarca granosa]|uniref:DZIP3-like HEPN domain-containing protein n=1 Tax=Tegillarca granosa TaxID=220873 RepID=A0ABQ9DWF1_TEGGR|nr:hypothetical protein KUTeg_024120 [Tegillarca granosa]